MTDLVEILQAHATTLGWGFSYGNKSNINRLQSDSIADRIYLLLDNVTRAKEQSEFGFSNKTNFTGSFMLVVKSNLDQKFEDKYANNIKPLLDSLELLEDLIDCSDLEIVTWTAIDLVDALDANLDGLIVTYNIKN